MGKSKGYINYMPKFRESKWSKLSKETDRQLNWREVEIAGIANRDPVTANAD